jgi:hypothetical protein
VRTVYLIGAPGAGKTTIMSRVLDRLPETARYDKPVKHTVHDHAGNVAVSLGWPRAPFGGTDTLGYAAINAVEGTLLPVLSGAGVAVVLGEGDRLATDRFLIAAARHGQVTLFYVDLTPEEAQQRRAARAEAHGLAPQNPAWATGRATKARNLAERHSAIVIPGDDTDTAADLIWTQLT